MELMSSSEDESTGCTSPTLPAHCERLQSSTSNDSLEDELLSPSTRIRANRRRQAAAGASQKPVISARELLTSFRPQQQKSGASPAREPAIAASAAAFSMVTPNNFVASFAATEKEEHTLSVGERIAQKYGLASIATTPHAEVTRSRVRSSSTSSHPSAFSSTTSDNHAAAGKETMPQMVHSEGMTNARSPWDVPTDDCTKKLTAETTDVSRSSNLYEYMCMKQKRRRRLRLEDEMDSSAAESARGAYGNHVKGTVWDVGSRPRDTYGSTLPDTDDGIDKLTPASKEAVSSSEAIFSNDATADDEVHRIPVRQSVISSRQMKRDSRKLLNVVSRHRAQTVRSGFSECGKGYRTMERWPQLELSMIDAGPMILRPSEGDSLKTLEVCANMNSYLYDYQREGVHFLYSAYQRNTGAILGDDMGLGKTIQVIAFLSAVLGKRGDYRDKDAWMALLHQRRERFNDSCCMTYPEGLGFRFAGETAPILIAMPATLLDNWEQELRTWMSCATIILRGRLSDRDIMIDQIARGEYEIVICSYDILKMHSSRLYKIPWETVILDEMHCLKNPESQLTKAVKSIPCRKKVGLTGTLMQNNEKELHCLIDTIAPGAIGPWMEFSMYYGNDIKYGRKKSAALEAVERSRHKEMELRRKLRPYYLRREKEINPIFQDVKKNDQVVFCDLTPLQVAAYRRVLAMPEFQLLQRGEQKCDCGRDSSEKRKKCCYKTPNDAGDAPGLLYERFHDNEPCNNCPNCMCLPCVAMLLKLSNHLELLKVNPRDGLETQQYQAAFARAAFGSDLDAVGGVNQVSSFQEMCSLSTKTCGKMIVLEKLLAVWKKRRERTLIFSRSTRMLDIIQQFLIAKATRYSRLDGKTKGEERLQMVNEFNDRDSNTSVFLISTRAGGVGLNLQSATNVVIFDPSWNPAHDCQAQDRAYRIGQTKDVQVYRLITLGTIEEMIYVRQIYKQQLSDTTLKGASAPRYFEGVQGNPRQRGELFGIANLIGWKPDGVLKGIQDAYQRSHDGLIVQQNRVRYDAVPVRKSTRKLSTKIRPATVGNDESEIIEVADELVSAMMIPEDSRATASAKGASAAVISDSCGEDMDALFSKITRFRHEEIVRKPEDKHDDEAENVQQSGSVDEIMDFRSEPDAPFSCRHSLAKKVNNQQISPSSPSSTSMSHGGVVSCAKNAKHRDGDPAINKKPHRTLYVPAYL
ncbi:unnamed protein product [Hyaloperonospora brassicae]|uniref:Uncharacterized protein n=1 Tax=Hyaloperonospora brassicae TaxID=162125 RepID=A0AAV0UBR4_HYABA|nr:unnamed protein product [Hyaloperonospora brassicae]